MKHQTLRLNFLSLVFLCLFHSASSHAVQSINTQLFNPSVSDHFVFLEDALRTEWPKQGKFYLGANYNYVNDPLVATDPTHTSQTAVLIDNIQSLDLFLGYKPDKQLGLYFGMPIHTVTYPAASQNILAGVNGSNTVLGDAKIMAKIRLNRDDGDTAFALIPEIHLPTGNTENFVSDASTYLAIRLAIERVFEKFTLDGNVGYATANNAVYADAQGNSLIDFKRRFIFGIGGFMPFTDSWGMNIEFNSQNPVPFSDALSPNEFYAGLRYAANETVSFTGGAGLGRIAGPTGQNIRLIAGVRIMFEEERSTAPFRPAPAPAPMVQVAQNPPPVPPPAAGPVVPIPPPPPLPPQHAQLIGKQIAIPTPIQFEASSDRLTVQAMGVLNEVADVINANKNSLKKIQIDGHTDNTGNAKKNLTLSLARAKSVKNYLIKKGIPENKLEARGFGQLKPKVSYSTPNAREINRRVEFNVIN